MSLFIKIHVTNTQFSLISIFSIIEKYGKFWILKRSLMRISIIISLVFLVLKCTFNHYWKNNFNRWYFFNTGCEKWWFLNAFLTTVIIIIWIVGEISIVIVTAVYFGKAFLATIEIFVSIKVVISMVVAT